MTTGKVKRRSRRGPPHCDLDHHDLHGAKQHSGPIGQHHQQRVTATAVKGRHFQDAARQTRRERMKAEQRGERSASRHARPKPRQAPTAACSTTFWSAGCLRANAAATIESAKPHATQAGFFYFDVADLNSPLRGATLDISGVDNASGAELLFFEIPMDNYLNAPKNP